MAWEVLLHAAFEAEFDEYPREVADELLAHAALLAEFGPTLGRPKADTLQGSQFPNMKELRFYASDGVWRVAFAFDPSRRAILLVAGDKSGMSENRFYKRLIRIADTRFAEHLAAMRDQGGQI